MSQSQRAGRHYHAVSRTARECCHCALNLNGIANADRSQFHAQRRRDRLDCRQIADAYSEITEHGHPCHARCDLFESSSNLAPTPNSVAAKLVMLPAGRAKLSTKPWPTGSATCANTTGILSVACCNAATLGVPDARMTSDARATNSAAPLRWRSASSPPHR